jgi:hypothetical protein
MTLPVKLVEVIRCSNPYYYLCPVPKKEFFFDREEELETACVVIKQILGGATGGVLVYGGRGSGKTSFLDELKRRLDFDGIVNAKVPLDPEMVKDGAESQLFATILQELISSARDAKLLETSVATKFLGFLKKVTKVESIELEFPGFGVMIKPEVAKTQFSYIVLRDGLRDFLRLIETQGTKQTKSGAVIMLDEGDALSRNEKLLHVLRNAFQEIRNIAFVIAGSAKLATQVGDVFSPVPRFFRKIELGPYPNDEVVDQAITKPLEIACNNLLYNNRVRLQVRHSGFDKLLKEVAGRTPMHINMLSYFAFDIGSKDLKEYEKGTFVIKMSFTKKLIEEAISQLRGTKGYSDFIGSLEADEIRYLRILSKASIKLSSKEAALMIVLDDLQESLQKIPLANICERMADYEKLVPVIDEAIKSINHKATAYDLIVLGSDILKKQFDIEDHWIRAYFRYGQPSLHFDMAVVEIPFFGVEFFGDSVASILHSIFFARLTKYMEPFDSMKVHAGATDGSDVWVGRNRKIILAIYKRTDDLKTYHLAFNLKFDTDSGPIKADIEQILKCIANKGLISDYKVKEESSVVYH